MAKDDFYHIRKRAADAYRMKWRYGKSGYKYLQLGAGPACLSCGVCAIAAFSDDDMNDLLPFDVVERFVI